MITVIPLAAVEPFVRECLGCGCPAAVFEEIESDIRELNGLRYQRLLAGKRLLVYLLSECDPARLSGQLEQLQRAGIAERDGAGYNRLRIVVPDRPGESQCRKLRAQFEQVVPGDEKVHLHFVPEQTLAHYVGKESVI